MPKESKKPKYLICNADESEPGTFKDRVLIENDPHMILEGMIIASRAIGANTSYIYIRGEFFKGARILETAIKEAYAAGYLGRNILKSGFDHDIYVHRGAGAYICGEETALMESLEGKRGYPRLKPPFPAIVGLFQGPTVINNVETLACVPHIIEQGAEWFKDLGTPGNSGTKLYAVSGHVKKPGCYELPMGTVLREIIYDVCGGILDDREPKAVIPGGSSVPVLKPEHLDVKMDFDSLSEIGSMLGSGGVIVMDETVCMVKALQNLLHFYAHESCGQCTPCREGTWWAHRVLSRIEAGQGREGDVDLLADMADNMAFKTICPLADAAVMPVESFIKNFREEFEYHIQHKKCMVRI
ncbi:NADH-quinone oxidoreductase subunit NuoF [Acidobacteriota bacterium]